MADGPGRDGRRTDAGTAATTTTGEGAGSGGSGNEATRPDDRREPVDLEEIVTPPVVAGLAVAVLVVVLALVRIQATAHLLALAGVAVLLAGLAVVVVRSLRSRPRQWWDAAAAAAAMVGTAGVVDVGRDQLTTVAGRTTGVALVVVAVGSALDRRDHQERTPRTWLTWFFGLWGLALLVLPVAFTRIGVLLGAALFSTQMVLEGVVRAGLLPLDPDPDDHRPLLARWLAYNARTNQSRSTVVKEFYFEGPDAPGRLLRFGVLMACAGGIATMGVVTDSTAVVIGAMLVAPLITPMMGMGLALTMGWPQRLVHSSTVVLLGCAIAVGVGAILPAAMRISLDLTSNSQITSRASPTVADLIIAVIAGATGAYANARRDVSSSLPGVAIAIALVPPLAIVGVTAQQGAWGQAAGTLLLFLTNLTAILLVGGVVFLITGVAPLRMVAANQGRVRTAVVGVALLAIGVVAGLLVNGEAITRDSLVQERMGTVVGAWLGDDSTFSVVSVEVKDNRATIVLAGPGNPPQLQSLAADVEQEFQRDLVLDVQWVARERRVLTTTGD
ncbi:MAG: DUF389 domain-containing protein [Acidimicrobiales bacterium]